VEITSLGTRMRISGMESCLDEEESRKILCG
jgi:hypothetical protein